LRHVAGEGDRSRQLRGQLADAFFHPIALVGQGQAHARTGEGLGARPGDRALVGDAEDETGLAFEDALQRCTPSDPGDRPDPSEAAGVWENPAEASGVGIGESAGARVVPRAVSAAEGGSRPLGGIAPIGPLSPRAPASRLRAELRLTQLQEQGGGRVDVPSSTAASSVLSEEKARTEPEWRRLLSGTPREVLARLVQEDPLGVREKVAARLRADALLLDSDRVHLRVLARVSRFAGRYRGRPDLGSWI